MSDSHFWSDLGTSVGFRQVVNPKKSFHLKNRTRYFDSSKDRTHVRFQSPNSYSFRQSKIEGYETRLYYEFLRTQKLNGQTFFYTLTYNDSSIPKYLGKNCFDYEDLRYLLNGGFKKLLERKYGTKLRYFVGAELGDGKGSRGLSNNPHYHILFFLRPDDLSEHPSPYVKISSEDFRHLVRKYWQGFDQDIDGWRSFKSALFGIAKEGESCGLVSDFRAVNYVAKYVCKDVSLKQHEFVVYRRLKAKYFSQYNKSEQSFFDYFKSNINSFFNIPLNVQKDKWQFTEKEFYKILAFRCPVHIDSFLFDDDSWMSLRLDIIKSTISFYKLWDDYRCFVNAHCDSLVESDLKVYRNRYCNKARISQGVGDYALDFIDDPMNPTVPIPGKEGIKQRPIGLFLFRKLYTEVYTDLEGRKTRFLSPLGIEYKLNNLDKNLALFSSRIQSQVFHLISNESLYNSIIQSDVNTDVSFDYQHFQFLLSTFDISLSKICDIYALFKLVYEDRFFKVKLDDDGCSFSFPDIVPSVDFYKFLFPSFCMVRSSKYRLDLFLENTSSDCLPYFSHPYFLRFAGVFSLFDLVSDYFFVTKDDKLEEEVRKIAETKRFHDKFKLDYYYSLFNMPYGKNS